MRRILILIVVTMAVVMSAAVVIAQTKLVTYKDGRSFVGTVTQKGDTYEIATDIGPIVTVPVAEVASIADYVSPKEQYKQRLAGLKIDDVRGHYDLAVWCQEQGLLKESMAELETVLKLEPKHENALLRMDQVKKSISEAAKPPVQTVKPSGEKDQDVLKLLVSEPDIMRVRLAELRSRDEGKVAVTFRNNARQRFLDRVRGHGKYTEPGREAEFLQKTGVPAAIEMLVTDSGSKDILADVLVKTNPSFMTDFKLRIWPMVAANCAAAACHGGPTGAGRLKLYNIKTQDDALWYTNFYILDSFEASNGRMIDRGKPAQSLLLQFGLPEDIARVQHPVKRTAMYSGIGDPRYRMVDEWIRSLLNPHPAYELDYRLPWEKPASGPATRSAAVVPAAAPAAKP